MKDVNCFYFENENYLFYLSIFYKLKRIHRSYPFTIESKEFRSHFRDFLSLKHTDFPNLISIELRNINRAQAARKQMSKRILR